MVIFGGGFMSWSFQGKMNWWVVEDTLSKILYAIVLLNIFPLGIVNVSSGFVMNENYVSWLLQRIHSLMVSSMCVCVSVLDEKEIFDVTTHDRLWEPVNFHSCDLNVDEFLDVWDQILISRFFVRYFRCVNCICMFETDNKTQTSKKIVYCTVVN